jgi:hypothetical protein
MMKKSKYSQLKSYLETKHSYYADLGKYNLGDRESMESEYKWRLLCDIMEYVDSLELWDDIDRNMMKKGEKVIKIN